MSVSTSTADVQSNAARVVEATVPQTVLADYFRTFGTPGYVFVVVKDRYFSIGDPDSHYILDHAADVSDDFESWVKLTGKEVAKYVRAARQGKNATVTIRLTIEGDNHTVTLDSAKVGEFSPDPVLSGSQSLNTLMHRFKGETSEIPDTAVAKGVNALPFHDTESSRYALWCILFDDNNVIGCDGRCLSRSPVDGFAGITAMVPATLVAWGVKYNESILNGYSLDHDAERNETLDGKPVPPTVHFCGNVVHRAAEGRYPRWEQVIPEDLPHECIVDAAFLQKLVDTFDVQVKAGVRDPHEERGVDFDLSFDPPEVTADDKWKSPAVLVSASSSFTLDWRWIQKVVKLLPKGTTRVTFQYEDGDKPVLFKLADCDIVVMPLTRDKAKAKPEPEPVMHDSGITIAEVIEQTGLDDDSPAIEHVGLPREGDPKLGDTLSDGATVVKVWRTAGAKEPDQCLHVVTDKDQESESIDAE